MVQCKICNNNLDMSVARMLQWHVKKIHNITPKEYYDLFKQKEEGICKHCEGPTTFITYSVGYSKFCSQKCASQCIETKDKIKTTKYIRYGNCNFNNRERVNAVYEKYGVENVSQLESIKLKKIQTCQKKFGTDNPLQNKTIYKKGEQTKQQKYGDKNYNNRQKFRETSIERYGTPHYSSSYANRKYQESLCKWIPLDQVSLFKQYYRIVRNITKKHKKELIDNWDGICYYTKQTLIFGENYNDPLYPVIDHKISIYYGFNNKIDPEIIGNIDNLCFCSREINTRKGVTCEKAFKRILKRETKR